MNLSEIQFHQEVNTPNGRGVVQGALRDRDGSIKGVLVSHANSVDPTLGKRRGIWRLACYQAEQIEAYHKEK